MLLISNVMNLCFHLFVSFVKLEYVMPMYSKNSNNIRFPETIAESFGIHLVMVYMLGCYL